MPQVGIWSGLLFRRPSLLLPFVPHATDIRTQIVINIYKGKFALGKESRRGIAMFTNVIELTMLPGGISVISGDSSMGIAIWEG